MSHDPSRKHFLAKLTGLVAVAGLAPRLFTKTRARPAVPAVDASLIALRPDSRAVARRS